MSLWSDEDDLLSSPTREERGEAERGLVLFVFVAAVYGSVRYGSLRRLGSTSHVAPGFLKSMVYKPPATVELSLLSFELCGLSSDGERASLASPGTAGCT